MSPESEHTHPQSVLDPSYTPQTESPEIETNSTFETHRKSSDFEYVPIPSPLPLQKNATGLFLSYLVVLQHHFPQSNKHAQEVSPHPPSNSPQNWTQNCTVPASVHRPPSAPASSQIPQSNLDLP